LILINGIYISLKPEQHPAEVCLSPTTKKLLIRLDDDLRKFLETLKIDKEALMAIDTQDSVRGVIVTTKVKSSSSFFYFLNIFYPVKLNVKGNMLIRKKLLS